jgi:hypothetical protein
MNYIIIRRATGDKFVDQRSTMRPFVMCFEMRVVHTWQMKFAYRAAGHCETSVEILGINIHEYNLSAESASKLSNVIGLTSTIGHAIARETRCLYHRFIRHHAC